MKQLLIGLCLFLPLSTVYADLSFPQLNELTKPATQLSGNFSQSKYLKLLDASIESSGVFEYQRNSTIRWITEKPVSNELIMTNTHIVNKQGNQELVKIDLQEAGSAKLFHELLFSVLTAEWNHLASLFTVRGSIKGESWVAILAPKDDRVKTLVESIELEGASMVDQIILVENGGNVTTIRFTYPEK